MIPEVSYEKGKETDVIASPTSIQLYHHRLHMYAKTLNRHFRDLVVLWGSTVYIQSITRSGFLGAGIKKISSKDLSPGKPNNKRIQRCSEIDFLGAEMDNMRVSYRTTCSILEANQFLKTSR